MSTITISSLPLGSVADTIQFATETSGGTTQKVTALAIKNYMTTLPNLSVTGTIDGIISTTASSQPNISALGTLTGLTTSGQIVSQVTTGTSPLVINSTSLVANLYVAKSAVADIATGGLTIDTAFSSYGVTDVVFSGNINTLVANLRVVNLNAGTWGGNAGAIYYVPTITVNDKGQITSAANTAVDLNLSTQAVTYLQGTTNEINVDNNVGVVTLSLPSTVNVNTLDATSIFAGTVDTSGAITAGGAVTDTGNRVLTSVTPTGGPGISISSSVPNGPTASFTINNTGAVTVNGGAGISVDTTTGDVTVTNEGVTGLAGANGISVDTSTGDVTVSPTVGYNGYGVRTISTGTPSGGSDGDIWYQV